MKTTLLKIGALALLISLISSCKKDSDPQPVVPTIVGDWYISNITRTECVSEENFNTDFICSAVFCDQISLTSGGTFTSETTINGSSTFSDTGTYRIMDDGYIEICRVSGTVCENMELHYVNGADTFYTLQLDGATGCVTKTSYIRL